jgi:hypothetical protein
MLERSMAKKMIGIKVTDNQKDKLQTIADKENRPLANLCLTLIMERALEKYGVDISKDTGKVKKKK